MNLAGAVQSSGERISYWLVPAQPDKSRLQRMIFALANRFGAPRFEPHVTIHSGPYTAEDDVTRKLARATREVSEIVLNTTGLGHSDEFTKTLFLQFAPDDRLLQLRRDLKRLLHEPGDYELNPHLSLLYANLPPETKAALARELMYMPTVRFNVVKAIVGDTRTQTREDVEAWRVVAESALVER
jgi:hypothetical protein